MIFYRDEILILTALYRCGEATIDELIEITGLLKSQIKDGLHVLFKYHVIVINDEYISLHDTAYGLIWAGTYVEEYEKKLKWY